jgi:hypothetical protein
MKTSAPVKPSKKRSPRKSKMCRLLQLDKATIRFGGLTAVSELDLQIGRKRTCRFDRPERRGQDDRVQSHHRRLPADQRAKLFLTASPSWAASRIASRRGALRGRSRTSGCFPR